jgi:hypothetical protein
MNVHKKIEELSKQHEKIMNEIPQMSEYKNIASAIDRLTTEMKNFIEAQQEILKVNFQNFLKEVFNEYPRLVSFSWTQGTPSFCDGDPCYFGANLNDDYEDFIYEGFDPEIHSIYVNPNDNTVTLDWREKKTRPALPIEIEYSQITRTLDNFIGNNNMKGVLESLYGDGTKVIVTRDGVETEEYYMD